MKWKPEDGLPDAPACVAGVGREHLKTLRDRVDEDWPSVQEYLDALVVYVNKKSVQCGIKLEKATGEGVRLIWREKGGDRMRHPDALPASTIKATCPDEWWTFVARSDRLRLQVNGWLDIHWNLRKKIEAAIDNSQAQEEEQKRLYK